LLGPPPRELLNAGKSSHKFFTDTGKLDVARFQTIYLFSWSLTTTLRCSTRGFPCRYSTPGQHFARGERDQLGRAESTEVPRHDAEDAPVGAFEAFLGQGAGRGRMDHGAYVEPYVRTAHGLLWFIWGPTRLIFCPYGRTSRLQRTDDPARES
jgi:hypothetical protein